MIDIKIKHKIIFYYCDELIVEVQRVLDYPHLKKFHIHIPRAISFIKEVGINYRLSQPVKSYIPEDENDNYIVALALQTNSGFITSGDKHILSQKFSLEKKYQKLKILTKAEFEKKFKY